MKSLILMIMMLSASNAFSKELYQSGGHGSKPCCRECNTWDSTGKTCLSLGQCRAGTMGAGPSACNNREVYQGGPGAIKVNPTKGI